MKLYTNLLNLLLYFLSKIIPKDNNIWLFGSWFGEKYLDNSKYLFEYINREYKNIKPIWITNNNYIKNNLRNQGLIAYKKYSLFAIYYGLKAGYSIFVQSNYSDVMPFLNNNRTKLIQLWHGIPLKKIGLDDKIHSNIYSDEVYLKIKRFIFPFLFEKYDLICSSSEEDKEKFESAFYSKKIISTGYPRNDIIYPERLNKVKVISYIPTFRDNINSEIDLFTDYQFNFSKWNIFLEKNSLKLFIKIHPVNRPNNKVLNLIKNSNNIYLVKPSLDIMNILKNTDILITDYSSVFFDFLLSNKPIIFSPFDYKNYLIKDRELYYNYNTVTPGPKCNDWEEILEWVNKFIQDPSLYNKERNNIKEQFHKYFDGRNCQRVYEEILKL